MAPFSSSYWITSLLPWTQRLRNGVSISFFKSLFSHSFLNTIKLVFALGLPQKCSMKSQMASKWCSAFILVDYGISIIWHSWLFSFLEILSFPGFQHTVVSVFPSSSTVVPSGSHLLAPLCLSDPRILERLNPGTYLNLHLFPWWLYLVLYSVFQ